MEENKGRRIHNLEELVELWPALLMRILKGANMTAVAYLDDARPVAFTEQEIVLEFSRHFRYEKALVAAKRFPYETIINECLATPHHLRFQLAPQSEDLN